MMPPQPYTATTSLSQAPQPPLAQVPAVFDTPAGLQRLHLSMVKNLRQALERLPSASPVESCALLQSHRAARTPLPQCTPLLLAPIFVLLLSSDEEARG
jgi:hypothetical protein